MKARIALIILLLFNCFVQPVVASEPIDVSLVQLIANPKDYDGKVVRVTGFVTIEFEGNAVYLHQEDFKHNITKNGLWIDVPDDMLKRYAEFDKKYVVLEGTFSATMKGHLGFWSGSIHNITGFRAFPERKDNKQNEKDAAKQNAGANRR
jgi:hypothetical protein